MITSVVANRVPNGKVSEISIEWGDDTQNPNWQYVERYIFFFGFETNGRMCKSAGTLSKDIADVMNDSGAFSATLQHTLDPFVKYTVQVAQDWTGDGFGRKSQAFGFTLNATRKQVSGMHCDAYVFSGVGHLQPWRQTTSIYVQFSGAVIAQPCVSGSW